MQLHGTKREFSEEMGLFYILTGAAVTRIRTMIKRHQMLQLRTVCFNARKLYSIKKHYKF